MTYMWEPKPDITAFELAIALRVLIVDLPTAGFIIDEFPDNVRRHFRLVVRGTSMGTCEAVMTPAPDDATDNGEG